MAVGVKSEREGCAPLGGPDCPCRAAVERAFAGMTQSGAAYDSAFGVALRVFRHHHPEIEIGASELVERWLSTDSLH